MLRLLMLLGVTALAAADNLNTLVFGLNQLTVVDLVGVRQCNIPAYPLDMFYTPGAAYIENEGLIVCGGILSSTIDYTSECYTFDGTTWTASSSLPTDSMVAGTDVHSLSVPDQGFWLVDTGAKESLLRQNGEWIPGPGLIHDYDYSCLLQLNSTHSMLTGGVETTAEVWLYDWTASFWYQVEDMQNARGKHVCAGLGDNMAMVVGGEGAHYSTEIYRDGVWVNTVDVPESVDWFGSLEVWNGTPLLIAGQDETRLWAFDGAAWEEVVLPVLYGREDYALILPDEFLQSCMA